MAGSEEPEGIALAANGPYLMAALLCERVLVEQDGVQTLVRVVDRLLRHTFGADPPEHMEPFVYTCAIYLRFRCGEVSGPRPVTIEVLGPEGQERRVGPLPVRFEGGENRFANAILTMDLEIRVPGQYWFHVYFEDRLAARIPLLVEYLPVRTVGP